MTLTDLTARLESLAATRDGLRARLDADPASADRWQLQRDIAATERAIAFAESKLRGARPSHETQEPAMAKTPASIARRRRRLQPND